MNKIIISGNVTAKPEMKTVPSGSTVCVFDVAVNNGKSTDFYHINAWSKNGENCQKYLDKGSRVCIIGDFKPSLFEGNKKTIMNLNVTAETVEFLSSTKKAEINEIHVSDLPF